MIFFNFLRLNQSGICQNCNYRNARFSLGMNSFSDDSSQTSLPSQEHHSLLCRWNRGREWRYLLTVWRIGTMKPIVEIRRCAKSWWFRIEKEMIDNPSFYRVEGRERDCLPIAANRREWDSSPVCNRSTHSITREQSLFIFCFHRVHPCANSSLCKGGNRHSKLPIG